MTAENNYVRRLQDLTNDDVPAVGGKNASLGEMIQELSGKGLRVPGGFATTADAYRRYLDENDLPERMQEELDRLGEDEDALEEVGQAVRDLITGGEWPDDVAEAIRKAYADLCERAAREDMPIAARSSATAEDLPEASFAGQQETYLNVRGEEAVLEACKKCYASLFTDRAISYRREQGFDHMDVALSVGVQRMVAAGEGSAGVMFTIDTETGFPDVIVINSAWGLGESVVGGSVNPDEFRVFTPLLDDEDLQPLIARRLGAKETKIVYSDGDEPTEEVETSDEERRSFSLSDDDALTLARWGQAIHEHYERPMDIEWARDGESEELFILQARPETVQSQKTAATLKSYTLKEEPQPRLEGLAIGRAVASGPARVLLDLDRADEFEDGDVLVTDMTDPDWVPVMNRAAAIVTDHGGRTSHAAIVSRELGVPAVVGTGEATETLEDGGTLTVSCASGDTGRVFDGEVAYETKELDPEDVPSTETEVMMILASPDAAFRWWNLPCEGIGLARMEFVINNIIKIHPLALTRFDELEDDEARERIEELTAAWDDKEEYFVDNLARGLCRIAASQYPAPCIVRMSDFKTNEYADLVGGRQFEPEEANPMLGFRGASRYVSERYRDGFALECRAIRRARKDIGLDNIVVMVPFCRTIEEAQNVLEVMAENGLERGVEGLEIYVMAEIPSNIALAQDFAELFDGFSIGTNDLTQLTLGVDRDSEELAHLFDERNEAVKIMVRNLIDGAHQKDRKVGLCGQAPSDHPDFAKFLVEAGIDSISVNPDTVIDVREKIAEAEKG